MSDRREDLYTADVTGADETVAVGAYRYVHTLRRGEDVTGARSVTLWAGFAASFCGCDVDREPVEVTLPHYPRLLANLLAALGEAARKAGPVDLDLMGDAYLAGLHLAASVAAGEADWLDRLYAAAAGHRDLRREQENAAESSAQDTPGEPAP